MQSINEIKTAVFSALQVKATEAVKQWAASQGLDVDLRTKQGWGQIASHLAKLAAAKVKATATAIHEADYKQMSEDAYNKAIQFKVAAKDGAIATYDTLKQHWGPSLRMGWECLKLVVFGIAIASLCCLRAGQQFRAFVDGFENTGMSPQAIVFHLFKPVSSRVQAWASSRVIEVNQLCQTRRNRELAIQFVGAIVVSSMSGLI